MPAAAGSEDLSMAKVGKRAAVKIVKRASPSNAAADRKGPSAPRFRATLKELQKPMPATRLAKLLSGASAGSAEPTRLPTDKQHDGGQVDAKLIRSHVAAGAPADERGRMCVIDYAAWLISRRREGG